MFRNLKFIVLIIALIIIAGCSDKKGDPIRPPSNNYFAIAIDICSVQISYHKVDEETAKSIVISKLKEEGSVNPEIWASDFNKGWAAFAYSTDMSGNCKFGFVWNYTTQEEAENQAISKCIKLGGENPKIIAAWLY